MIHFKDNKNKSALSTRWAQMSKQEQIIERKKMEIQAKLESQKQAAALAAQAKLSNPPSTADDTGKVNIFSNDGSFMSQFKALLEKQKKDTEVKNEEEKPNEEENAPIDENQHQNEYEDEYEQHYGGGNDDRRSFDRGQRDKHRRWNDRGHHRSHSPMTPVIEDRKKYSENQHPHNIPPLMQLPVMPPSSQASENDHQWMMSSKSDEDPESSVENNVGPAPMGPGPMGPGPMPPGIMGPGIMGPRPGMGPMPGVGMNNMGPGMGPGPGLVQGAPMGPGPNGSHGANLNSESNMGPGQNMGLRSNMGPGGNMSHGPNMGPGGNMGHGPNMGPGGHMGPGPNMGPGNMGMGPNSGMGPGPGMGGPGSMMRPRGPMPPMPHGGPMPPFMGGPPNFPMPPNFMGPNGPNGPMPPNMCGPNGPNGPMPPFFGPPFPNPMMGPNGPPNSMMPPNSMNNGNMPFMGPRPPFGPNGPPNFGNGPPRPPYMQMSNMPDQSSENPSMNTNNNLPPPISIQSKPTDMDSKPPVAFTQSQVFSADSLPPSAQRAAAEVARNGDHWENVLKAIHSQDQNLWFLHNTNSNEYKAFRDLVNKLKGDKPEVKPEDKYEPEFSLEDDDSNDDNKYNVKREYDDSNSYGGNQQYPYKREASSQSDEEPESKRERRKKKKSRWSDEPPATDIQPPGMVAPLPTALLPGPKLAKIDEEGLKLSSMNRNNQALMQYAMTNYGTTNLSAEDWKKCEDNFKLNLLYQDMLKKRQEVERLAVAGKYKYEYDSDEDTAEGTWEHKLRAKEMNATERWADELTKQAAGKHHIGDFLPPEELKKFMEKYSAVKSGKEPDLSDYKEFKLKEDNLGFKMLQKLGWSEGQGLGAEGSGIVEPINKGNQPVSNLGLGASTSDNVCPEDDEFDAYRKRMMLAYRFRPNPLNNPRRPYY